ncbi:hypothetical protein KSP39_PZI012436 [Platanthera zijinensis]|uniref:Uncharacterized protein n=1 Tax=Platanthera zijinensis TaxID=2320716 RepID=A0AAP0G570_9ASPA
MGLGRNARGRSASVVEDLDDIEDEVTGRNTCDMGTVSFRVERGRIMPAYECPCSDDFVLKLVK